MEVKNACVGGRLQAGVRRWDHCPTCGRELDTGWECNGCGLDWEGWAYPWWRRLLDALRRR